MVSRGKTLFIDIDGTLFEHGKDGTGAAYWQVATGRYTVKTPRVLPGVLEAFNNWHGKGYRLILTTGRCESTRAATEQQLREAGLFWDVLIMGVGGGQRILINDLKSDGAISAVAINVKRDDGVENINELYSAALKQMGVSNPPTEI